MTYAKLASVLLLAFAGCRATEPDFFSDGEYLGNLEPAPFRILLMPFSGDKSLQSDEIKFAHRDKDALLAAIAEDLRMFRAASRVVRREEMSDDELETDFDLVITPRITQSPQFGYEKMSGGRSWFAAGLWLTTWFGGLVVEDSTYAAKFQVHYDVANVQQGVPVEIVPASSAKMDLTFFDRNRFLRTQFFVSMILPPQLTGDDDKVSSKTLTRRVVMRVAARLAKWLKTEIGDVSAMRRARLVLESPARNGSTVSGAITVKGRLESPHPIEDVRLFLNGKVLDYRPTASGKRADGTRTLGFSVYLDRLSSGENFLQIRGKFGGVRHSRTLVFRKAS